MHDISNTLNCCRQGCCVNGVSINHLMYADDMVLIICSCTAATSITELTSVIPMRLIMTLYITRKRHLCMCVKPKQL